MSKTAAGPISRPNAAIKKATADWPVATMPGGSPRGLPARQLRHRSHSKLSHVRFRLRYHGRGDRQSFTASPHWHITIPPAECQSIVLVGPNQKNLKLLYPGPLLTRRPMPGPAGFPPQSPGPAGRGCALGRYAPRSMSRCWSSPTSMPRGSVPCRTARAAATPQACPVM